MYLVVLCRRSMMTSTLAKEQLDNVRVTGTIHKLGGKKGKQMLSTARFERWVSDVCLILEISHLDAVLVHLPRKQTKFKQFIL